MSENNEEDVLQSGWRNLKNYARLYAENVKLLSIEKAALMLSTAAMALVVMLFAVIAFFFMSMGFVLWLAESMPLTWCYLIMAGVYVVLAVLAYVLRETIFINPVARFISRLFIDNPNRADLGSHKQIEQ